MNTTFNWDMLLAELEQTLTAMTPADWDQWEIERAAGAAQYEAAQAIPASLQLPLIVSSYQMKQLNIFSENLNKPVSEDTKYALAA